MAPHLMGNIVNWEKLAPLLKKKGILIIAVVVLIYIIIQFDKKSNS